MAEARYQMLSAKSQHAALTVAEQNGNYSAHLLEKDIWVVATLGALFGAPCAKHLTFKGGTSLSKVWGAIHRFSEDIDITYDIRALAPDLVSGAGDEPLPPTRSQAKRWRGIIEPLLTEWVGNQARPIVEQELSRAGFAARVRSERTLLYIGYDPLFEGSQLVRPEVVVEFGGRSTGEPNKIMPVVCDAAEHLPEIVFPEACAPAMLAERTFWEKATAIHVFCRQERLRSERMSRHWHDLAALDKVGIAANAMADQALALSVARHKHWFFSENDASGERIDYEAAVSGNLQLVPSGAARTALADDYATMRDDGMLLDENQPFDALMERCAAIEAQANNTLAE